MKSKILKTIHQFNMLSKGDRVLVAFSGGADSVTLLHFLAMNAHELGITVSAAHVNHMLRGDESDRDEQFCYDFCDALNVPLYIKSVDINALSKKQKLSHETCARNVRYDFFGQITAGADNYMIATAHTLSDCCETLLLNLARGSSMTGLRSIPPRRGKIIRPLIECTREEIEDYIAQNGLRYVTDSTNLTDEYTRNIIRHNIIPVLHEINRGAEYSIGRAISSVRRDEEYLDLLSETAFSDCRRDGGFDAEALSRLPDSLRFRVIEKLLSQSGFELSYELILSVDRAIKENKSANLPLGKKLFCAGGAIVISDQKKTSPQKTGECLALSPGSPVRIAGKQIYISVPMQIIAEKNKLFTKNSSIIILIMI